MNNITNIKHTIHENIIVMQQGTFQEFCKDFLLIHDGIEFKRFGATPDGKTRKGTPDFIFDDNPQKIIGLQVSVEKQYWIKGESKPKTDIDKCIEAISGISKIYLCSSFGYKTSNPEGKANVIAYGNSKGKEITIYSIENFEDILSNDLKNFSSLIENENYFTKEDSAYLKKYYMTEEDYISICKENINLYKKIHINYEDNFIIKRDQTDNLYNTINMQDGLLFLVSSSGKGKSTICAYIADCFIKNKQFVLRINPKSIEQHDNYEHWIIDAFNESVPSFETSAIEVFKNYIAKYGLLLIIDDINVLKNKRNLISKLISIAKKNKADGINIKMLCPVWNDIEDNEQYNYKNNNCYSVFILNRYNEKESIQAIKTILKNKNIPEQEIDVSKLALQLSNDPYLIGILRELNIDDIEFLSCDIENNIFEIFLDRILKDIEETSSSMFNKKEYKNALLNILYTALENKQSKISFTSLSDSQKNLIRPILNNTKICRLDDEDNIIFRHDRLKFYLELQSILSQQSISNAILLEPFYYNLIGHYIAIKEISSKSLIEIQKYNPASIIASVNYIKDLSNSYLNKYIIETFKDVYIDKIFDLYSAKDINDKNFNNIGPYFHGVKNIVNTVLIDINKKQFVDLINKKYPKDIKNINSLAWNLLNFKFGSLMDAVIYYLGRNLDIVVNDEILNNAISYVKLTHDKKKIRLFYENILSKIAHNTSVLKSTLIIIGLFELDDIGKSIQKIWKEETNKDEMLPFYIFAQIKSFNIQTKEYLTELLNYWKNMPETKNDYEKNHKSDVLQLLNISINNISDEVITFLINFAEKNKDMCFYIAHMLENIDKSIVYKFIIKLYAESDSFRPIIDGKKIKNLNTIKAIKEIWIDETQDSKYRYWALQFYSCHIVKEDIIRLKKLENIEHQHKELYLLSCQLRARLNDYSVTDKLCKYIEKTSFDEATFLLIELQNIWNRNFIQFITDFYKKNCKKNCYVKMLADLLLRIDKKDAESIINILWKDFKQDKYFLGVAFYIGTPEIMTLIENYLSSICGKIKISCSPIRYPSDIRKDIYKMNSFYKNIERYLDRIDPESLMDIAYYTNRIKMDESIYKKIIQNIDPQILKKSSLNIKDKDFFLEELDKRYYNKTQDFWFYSLGFSYHNDEYKIITSKEEELVLSILDEWFNKYKDLKAFNICAMLIYATFKRKNIDKLKSLKNNLKNNKDHYFADKIIFYISYSIKASVLD